MTRCQGRRYPLFQPGEAIWEDVGKVTVGEPDQGRRGKHLGRSESRCHEVRHWKVTAAQPGELRVTGGIAGATCVLCLPGRTFDSGRKVGWVAGGGDAKDADCDVLLKACLPRCACQLVEVSGDLERPFRKMCSAPTLLTYT